jgi:hypothetical protein
MEESGQEEQGEGEAGGGGGHVEERNTGDAQGGGKSAEGGLSESNGMEQSASGATSTAREPPANPARSVELRPKSIRELQLELRGAHNSCDSPASPAGSRLPAAQAAAAGRGANERGVAGKAFVHGNGARGVNGGRDYG